VSSKLPEGIDYTIISNDPSDASDDCVHEVEDGPHEHRRRVLLTAAAGTLLAVLWLIERYWPLVLVLKETS